MFRDITPKNVFNKRKYGKLWRKRNAYRAKGPAPKTKGSGRNYTKKRKTVARKKASLARRFRPLLNLLKSPTLRDAAGYLIRKYKRTLAPPRASPFDPISGVGYHTTPRLNYL